MKKSTLALLGLTMTISTNVIAEQEPTNLSLHSGFYGAVGLGINAQLSKVRASKDVATEGALDIPFSGSAMAGVAGLHIGYMASIGEHKWLDFHANYEQFMGGKWENKADIRFGTLTYSIDATGRVKNQSGAGVSFITQWHSFFPYFGLDAVRSSNDITGTYTQAGLSRPFNNKRTFNGGKVVLGTRVAMPKKRFLVVESSYTFLKQKKFQISTIDTEVKNTNYGMRIGYGQSF